MHIYDFKNKKTNINQLNNYMLAKTLSMFEYENLPDSIPVRELERLLQTGGYAFITKAPNGKLYAFHGGLGGIPCPYGNPTEIIIANPALNFYKTLKLKTDGVLIRSDDLAMGLMPMYEKYHGMLVENDINIVLDGYSTRMNTVISASDDKTKESAEAYMSKVVDGEISIIGENALFDGVRVQTGSGGAGTASSRLIELTQYLKGSLYNEVGLSSNFIMKKERLITAEVEQQEDGTFPFVYNMMKCRLKGIERVNAMFGTNIDVDFGSVWNIKNRKFVDDVIDDDTDDNRNYDDYEDYQEDENFVDTDGEGEIEDTEVIEQVVEDEVSEEIIEESDEIETVEDEPEVIESESDEPEVIESDDIETVEDEVSDVITIEEIKEVVEDAVENVITEMTDEVIEELETVIDEIETKEDEDMNLLYKEDGTVEELTSDSFGDLINNITIVQSDNEDDLVEVTEEYVDFTDDTDYSELEEEMLILDEVADEIIEDEVIDEAIEINEAIDEVLETDDSIDINSINDDENEEDEEL